MPWLVGIDEAGYGPNLGPLVQAAVVCRVPDDGCLWARLSGAVRRATDEEDDRLLVEDSKLVNAGPGGLARLERGVLAVLGCAKPSLFGEWLAPLACGLTLPDLAAERWYDPAECLAPPEDIASAGRVFRETCKQTGVGVTSAHTVVTPAARFNAIVGRYDSKAVVLAEGLIALLGRLPDPREPTTVVVDKQGGRNFYAAILQAAFPDRWVAPVRESADWSEYHIGGPTMRVVFLPRAESAHLPVALASMLAKYLRERFMRQFNRYWIGHVPGLSPTAGYPTDAKRFFDAIRPMMSDLGIPADEVWRRR